MAEQQTEAQASEQQFGIQRIYTKDVSFETPNSPSIFQSEWKPEVNLEIGTKTTKLQDDTHEVELNLTATVKSSDKTAFLVEIKQAGIFTIRNLENEQLSHLLGSFCPNILFPYAREAISSIVNRGGFPPLYLAPINFDALYAQQQSQQATGSESVN